MELLIYMGLMSIFLYVLTQTLLTILENQTESRQVSMVDLDGRFLMAKLAYDLHKSNLVSLPVYGQSGAEATAVIDGIIYTYGLDANNNMQVIDPGGAYQLNGFDTKISNLTFENLGNFGGNASVKISFTVSSRTTSSVGNRPKNFQITSGQRCKNLGC